MKISYEWEVDDVGNNAGAFVIYHRQGPSEPRALHMISSDGCGKWCLVAMSDGVSFLPSDTPEALAQAMSTTPAAWGYRPATEEEVIDLLHELQTNRIEQLKKEKP